MVDKITISGLQLASLIGVYEWERHAPQPLIADVELTATLQKAALSDDVADTIDYAKVADCLADVASNSHFELLEALAWAMIQAVFANFQVESIRLTLSKPQILKNATNVGVTLFRTRYQLDQL